MKRTSLALVLIASFVRLLGGFAVWTARQILNTDDWVETSSELHASDVLSDEELAAEKKRIPGEERRAFDLTLS